MPYGSTNFTVEHLEWFGGNRLLLVIRGNDDAQLTIRSYFLMIWDKPGAHQNNWSTLPLDH
jgi:hypothetical protein